MNKTIKYGVMCLFVLLLVNIDIFIKFYFLFCNHKIKPIECERIEYIPSKRLPEITRYKAINLVREHFGMDSIIKFKELPDLYGNSHIMLNLIYLDSNIDWWEAISTLAHEFCHIKYYTANETFTEYMAFVELYESDNEYLHNRAEWLIWEHCTCKSYSGTDYECSYHILEYLKEHKND